MPRVNYKKWRSIQDFGIRPGMVLPAWKEGDQVEVIGTAVRGRITRCTTLDFTRWEVLLPTGNFVETHANNLRAVLA
jgi:hypothetical protein